MRSFSHWSVPYARDRARDILYRLRRPDHPWLTRDANALLESWLRPDCVGFEWGSGRSTIWFARRVSTLTSVEHDVTWHERVAGRLRREGLQCVSPLLRPVDETEYVGAIDAIADGALDFVLVDGVTQTRAACATRAVPKLRCGGLLIVDDVNRYLPSASRSPNSLPIDGQPADPSWASFADTVRKWPLIWTSDGIKDTAIWTRP